MSETRSDRGLPPRWKPTEDDWKVAEVAGVEVWAVNSSGLIYRPRVALRGPDGDVVFVEYPVGLILAEAVRSTAILQGAKP